MDENLTNKARIIVRIGFIVAGADGLSDEERAFLNDYAVERSGLSVDDVAAEAKAAEAGLSAVTEDDVASLKELPKEQLSMHLSEVVEKAAGADGVVSEAEEAALKDIWGRLTG